MLNLVDNFQVSLCIGIYLYRVLTEDPYYNNILTTKDSPVVHNIHFTYTQHFKCFFIGDVVRAGKGPKVKFREFELFICSLVVCACIFKYITHFHYRNEPLPTRRLTWDDLRRSFLQRSEGAWLPVEWVAINQLSTHKSIWRHNIPINVV